MTSSQPNLPKHEVVITSGPPLGYHPVAVGPPLLWLTACDRCGAVVPSTEWDVHDRWHMQQAMRL